MNIGIDLGGTNIVGGIVSADGKIVLKKSVPTLPSRNTEDIIADIIGLCKDLSNQGPIKSIGIGCPGTVNPLTKTIVNAANIGFFNIPIGKIIEKKLSIPVLVENDANCAALGEAIWGAAKDNNYSVTITLGTGIGGGIIIGGSIYSGAFFGAGEVGHHVIHINGELCACGQRGCFEAYASASALIRDTRDGAINNPQSTINEIVNGNLNAITAKTAFDAVLLKDQTAMAITENYFDYLCVGLSNITNILQPDTVVLGGGISGQGENLLSAVKSRIKDKVLTGNTKTRFVIAQLGNDAGIIGASML
ncbi:MAG: ROK family protein [Defluviitaleaceae bacterium]|nr:ROK family protein [Defluviitaleaceae bacterium]